MKVYRLVNQSMNNDTQMVLGHENESRNLLNYGLISPSFQFVASFPNFVQDYPNTFGKDLGINKYFFGSLVDAIVYAKYCYKLNYYHFRDKNLYAVMEIDIDDEILKKYVGMGFYNYTDMYLEFRLPYLTLYEQIGKKDLEYFAALIDFYDQNMFNENMNLLPEYQEFLKLLNEESRNIYQYKRLSIYPLFCFLPKQINLLWANDDPGNTKELLNEYLKVGKKIKRKREKEFNYSNYVGKLANFDVSTQSFNHDFSREELFSYATPILEEENMVLKRTLENYKYHF